MVGGLSGHLICFEMSVWRVKWSGRVKWSLADFSDF